MNTLSSFVGAWIALTLFGVVAVVVVIGLIASIGAASSTESISKKSVLVINLEGQIVERDNPMDLDYMSLLRGDIEKPQTLTGLVTAIKEAGENKDISAIYLKCKGVSASPATLDALRDALSGFRKTGKKVVAYAPLYLMGDYYVASVADRVMMNPAGEMILQGLGGTNLYLKGFFDKLGISFQVVKVGTYKSAVEPYIMTEMSAPARAQLDTLYGDLWKIIRENISAQRKKLTPASIDSLVNNDFIFTQPSDFDVRKGLVDKLVYEREIDSIIGKLVGVDKKSVNYVSPSALLSQTDWGQSFTSRDQVAVLFACGEIVDGGGAGTIDYKKLVPEIVKLAENEKVKGLVLRVNSPGGAVFGSEQIGEALDYFMSTGKPLAVSMGDYAASGGYWISCKADRIFANPMTITGSIGIFGLIPNGQGLAEKLGVNPQTVSTNPEADFPTLYRPMTERQQAAMQRYVERGYDQFVKRVASGRKMPEEKVRRIGEGRVWSAGRALELGLVDAMGSLDDACGWVAEKAGIKNKYDVALYPTLEESMLDMIPQLGRMKSADALVRILEGDYDDVALEVMERMLRQKPVQARMPYISVGFPSRMPVD